MDDFGRSRGYGFVTFATSADADNALRNFNGRDFAGKKLRIEYANEEFEHETKSRGHEHDVVILFIYLYILFLLKKFINKFVLIINNRNNLKLMLY